MATKDVEKSDRGRERRDDGGGGDGPRQHVRRMAVEDEPEVGPYFPSGMSAPEAALAGATEGVPDAVLAQLRGEPVSAEDDGDE